MITCEFQCAEIKRISATRWHLATTKTRTFNDNTMAFDNKRTQTITDGRKPTNGC